MTVNSVNLFASLEMMWKGMLGLFAVAGFITLLVMLISKFTMGEKKENGLV